MSDTKLGRVLVVILAIYKEIAPLEYRVYTQVRTCFDPNYQGRKETIGESLDPKNPFEDPVSGAIRAVLEEAGRAISQDCFETSIEDTTTGIGDHIRSFAPIMYVQGIEGPGSFRLHSGPGILVRVPADWEPDPEKRDGEAGEWFWQTPEELLQELREHPGMFFALHIPVLKRACEILVVMRSMLRERTS